MSPKSEHVPGWRIPALFGLLWAIVGLLLWQRLSLATGRDFDPDELQHMHGGFSVAEGLVPYVDYFEHHTPWFGWLAARLVEWLGPIWDTLMAARWVSGLLSVAALGVTWALARTLAGRSAAIIALAIHGTILSAIDKGIEIRPDVPAALLFSISLALAARSLRKDGSWGSAFTGGLALGAGLMFTPKLAFAAVGIGVGALLFLSLHGPSVRRRMPRLLTFVGASFVPAIVTALALHRAGYFGAFVESVVTGPLGWMREVSPAVHLAEAVARNPIAIALGVTGLVAMLCRGMAFRKDSPEEAEPLLFLAPLAALAILAGWFVIPVPWPQYLLPLWPLIGIGAAQLIGRLRSGLECTVFFSTAAALTGATFWSLDLGWQPLVTAFIPPLVISVAAWMAISVRGSAAAPRALAWGVAGTFLALGAYRFQPHALPWAAPWGALALVIFLSPREHRLRATALAFLIAGPMTPIARLIHERPLFPFRLEFDEVMSKTKPGEAVLTGWRGCAVFRPHAYRHFFLHQGVLQMLTDEELGALPLEAIRQPHVKAAIRDKATAGLSRDVQNYLDQHFVPSGVGELWFRKP